METGNKGYELVPVPAPLPVPISVTTPLVKKVKTVTVFWEHHIEYIQIKYHDEVHKPEVYGKGIFSQADAFNVNYGETISQVRFYHGNGSLLGFQLITSTKRQSPVFGTMSKFDSANVFEIPARHEGLVGFKFLSGNGVGQIFKFLVQSKDGTIEEMSLPVVEVITERIIETAPKPCGCCGINCSSCRTTTVRKFLWSK